VDINSFEDYNVFSLPNPFRIVIDVRGEAVPASPVAENEKDGPDAVSLARQLALGVRRIVIDPGHGGKDYGAPGYLKGVHEKYIVLDIARKLADKISRELGCEAILTRTGDHYLTLEERTAIANTKKADLFISIHANASRNPRASGIETYFLNLTADDESITVAARENATSEKNISELQTILNDLLQNAKINESSRLATYVQKELCFNMEKKYNRINNKGVKRAPFYVLIGAQMPAILIETSFISNKTECQRLTDNAYQNALCDGIVSGIRKYIKETQPTAYFHDPAEPEPQG
jgi:N-acetylmuramoyl-L-alanine amidase